jgi:hypothetical protein
MKTAKFFFAALLLSGNIVTTYTLANANEIPGFLFEEEFVPDSFCRMEIMALTTQSFAGQQPISKRPNSDEVIDYYGPCSETPVGQDQADTQRPDQYGWENNYTR